MKKRLFYSILVVLILTTSFSQTTTISQFNTLIKPNHNIGLTNPLWNQGCLMTYDVGQVNSNGGAFSFNFTNPGGNGYKGYPSATIGGFKSNGTYSPGTASLCGMPVKIQDLSHNLRIKWKVSQSNATDADDKWWASINVIFDNTLPQYEPIQDNRDYDLVIELNRYQQEDFLDVSSATNQVYWYYARNTNGSLKTLDFNYNGTVYSWVVRYKFFNYPVGDPNYDKNDKVHVKFTPLFNTNVAPYLDHSLKKFIDTSVQYLQYVPLTPAEQTLANQKVGNPNLYIKSIAAGYEVYTGSFTIRNDYFYTVLDSNPPASPLNLSLTRTGNQVNLDWSDNTESDFNTYKVYRSINNGSYSLLADNVNTSSYIDSATVSGKRYSYYVVATDRSYNVSQPSTIRSISLKNSSKVANSDSLTLNPNPTEGILTIEGLSEENVLVEVYNLIGVKVASYNSKSDNAITIDLSNSQSGMYFVKIISEDGDEVIKKVVKK